MKQKTTVLHLLSLLATSALILGFSGCTGSVDGSPADTTSPAESRPAVRGRNLGMEGNPGTMPGGYGGTMGSGQGMSTGLGVGGAGR